MSWLSELFTSNTVAHSILILSLVSALGLAIGSFKIRGIGLGIAGVLFAGLIFGHFHITIDHDVMEFVREFGLVLFVYTIGMQVGPGFFSSLKRSGLRLNMMAAAIVLLGAAIAFGIAKVGGVNPATAVGLFSGATTNTPSLGASQQVLKTVSGYTEEMSKLPGMGYAVSYPFGILGIIITMFLIRGALRIDPKTEAADFEKSRSAETAKLEPINLLVENPNLFGQPISKIPGIETMGVVISRIMSGNTVEVARLDTTLQKGDIILAVGKPDSLENLRVIVGSKSTIDLRKTSSKLSSRRIVVSHKEVLGKTLETLNFNELYDVTITRIVRTEIELAASPEMALQYGDMVVVVGEESAIEKAAKALGNSIKDLNHPEVIPVFVGIALGVILGSIPFHFSGIPAPIKLGIAGGPLLVAILLSRIGNIGNLVWYMPTGANHLLREVGIALFLACVGLKSGGQFANTLLHGDGFYWMFCGALITLIPILIVGFIGRLLYKQNYLTLCGVLAGSMTDPPALAFATKIAATDAPSIAYATVYPLTMILRVIAAQVLVLLLLT